MKPTEETPHSTANRAQDAEEWLDEGDIMTIEHTLRMTPAERLKYAQGVVDAAKTIRSGRRG